MHKLRLDLVKESEAVAAVDAEDEVYEEIEAPKFVDFTLPDRSRPDDGSWFCARVGCDQTHEVVDPDALHRSFRLRIMAARSPNVRRHQKALDRESPSLIPKCPHSAPAKSAKSRPVGLSTMISVPEKRAKAKLQDHPISSLRSTPCRANARVQHCTTKVALTTPRNRKCPSNQEGFRSVKHQREPVGIVKDRIVAKVLFADTDTSNNTKEKPAKTTQSKCNSSVSKVNADTKKLKVGGRTRSVPSRYLCISTTPKSLKKDEESSARSLKKAKETKKCVKFKSETPSKLCDPSKLPETNRDKSNDMEIDGVLYSQSATDTMFEEHLPLAVTSAGHCDLTLDSVQSAGVESKNLNSLRTVEIFQKEIEPEISLPDASCIPDIQGQKEEIVTELDDDDKENASVASEERVTNSNSENRENESMKSVARETVPPKKLRSQIKPSADRGKHTRTTNPRPFKLRVDERQILKEAHQRIKLQTEAQAQAEKANENKLGRGEGTKAYVGQEKTPQKTRPSEASKKTPLKDRSVLTPKKLTDPQVVKEHDTMSPANTLKGSRSVTVPKEPNFHRLHLPRDCSKRRDAGEVQS